jgi:hypothetical protein
MQLSEENKRTLLINLHKSIEEAASTTANNVFHGRSNQLVNYPPNGGLTENEIRAIEDLKGNEDLKSALRKLFASTASDVLFDFFNIIDGTSDPDPGTGQWSEVIIVDKPEDFDDDVEFLHDDFYGSYWDWKEKRVNKNWSLDIENKTGG